jgi:hypothetical protein
MKGHEDQTRAYLDFKSELEAVLYDDDPFRMGSSIGAPSDEYSEVAARLIPTLLGIARGDSAESLTETLPDANERLTAILIEMGMRFAPLLAGSNR